VDEAPDRLARVREGEVLVAAIGTQNPRRVPGGLIHDWVGAVFIQGATLRDVLRVMRDYDQYKEFYAPALIDSKVIARSDWKDRYSTLFVDKSLFLKTALETDYESCYVRVDDRQGYSVSRATRIQEIEEYGTSGQRVVGDGKGNGLVWRLFNITRYLERDGGVYLELDAVGLSRDIPPSLRWLIEPIVRRLSRGSLSTSLRQTANAVQVRAERH
jgi:hypothetical protein